jgi:hypothetical protein
MRTARTAAVLVALLTACSRAEGPRPLPAEWVARGGGPGPAIGEPMPDFELAGHDGKRRTLRGLLGAGGLLLNFNRSVVW